MANKNNKKIRLSKNCCGELGSAEPFQGNSSKLKTFILNEKRICSVSSDNGKIKRKMIVS